MLSALLVLAWNRGGHMVTGIVAYEELKATNPSGLTKIITLLKQHPDYPRWQSRISEQSLAEGNGDLYLFALAARRADDVRQSSFDHPTWHCVNISVIPPGQAASVTISSPAPENILTAFAVNVGVLNTKTQATEKAVALCWLFHLIGDVHQPLHTTALFSSDYPKGDRGGNSIFVRVKPISATINLHAFWDDLVMGGERFQATYNRATELRVTLNRRQLGEIIEKRFSKWAEESFALAVQYAYRNGAITRGASKDDGVALPDDYLQQTELVADRRVVLAGYRLADTLVAVASNRICAEPVVNVLGQSDSASNSGTIRGNRNSHIYPLFSCPGYDKVSEPNRVTFKTEAEAQRAGYRKARNCP